MRSSFGASLLTKVHTVPLRCVCTVAIGPGTICDMQCVGLVTWLCWVYIPPTVVAGEAVSRARMRGVRIHHVWLNYIKVRFVISHTCSNISYCLLQQGNDICTVLFRQWQNINIYQYHGLTASRYCSGCFFAKVDLGQPIKIQYRITKLHDWSGQGLYMRYDSIRID
jgi:hypothetical protein